MNKKITRCRVCQSPNLIPISNFGNQYLTNFPPKINRRLPKCPLNLVFCNECGLLQLGHTFNRDDIYRDYWYLSGINETMRNELKDIAEKAEDIVELKENDIVLDIGSNDSTLLKSYTKKLRRVGFEPASNLVENARGLGLTIINNYFNTKDFVNIYGEEKAKVITAIAMFYDLDDPNSFVLDMVKCLDENGVIIIQLNYTPTMIRLNAFDNVMHEHLEYYTLKTLKYLFDKYELDIFNVEQNEVNGGSIRLYICKKGKVEISPNVKQLLDEEEKTSPLKEYKRFAKESKKIIKKVMEFIEKESKDGKTIYVYGASSRGNTILQACKMNKILIEAAAERNPMKYGKVTVGTWIPIVSEEEMRKAKPNYLLVLPWQFRKEIVEREKEYLNNGGKMIFIFPQFEIWSQTKK